MAPFFYLRGARIMIKGGLRNKIVLMICSSVLIIMFIAIGLTYVIGIGTLHNMIGKECVQIADMLGGYVADEVLGEIYDVESYATRPLWRDVVKEANLKYAGMDAGSMMRYFADMDKKWTASEKDSLLIREYLDSRVSLSMKDLLKIRKNIAELFITDKFGGLVASSGKTTDFYQADEKWWQDAYAGGKGGVFLSDIEFDQSSNDWVISIAVPLKDNEEVIGICKVSVATKRLFESLDTFKLGRTGHASLTTKDGYVIFHCSIPTMSKKLYREEALRKLFTSGKRFGTIYHEGSRGSGQFVAFSKAPMPGVSKDGMSWILFIDQDAAETFEPLNRLLTDIVLIVLALVIIMIPISYFFSNIIVKHIHKLRVATEKMSEGDLSYKIEVNTGDEIEQLADSFMSMAASIKNKQDELIRAKTQLEELSKELEGKVAARTKDLEKVNDATLNILEDLTEAKNNIDKYSKELENAIKIKSDFTSMVSHELRTPLTAIKEGIAIVLDGAAGSLNKEQAQFLDIAKRNVDRLARLINDILDFQKLESGKMLFATRDNDINEAVQEVYKTMLPLANNKGLTITLNEDRTLPKVRFDKDKIAQVMANLVNNAIKFTDKGGITITTSRQGDSDVRVSVSDTGRGIKEEDMPRLFQQFEQLEKGIDRKTAGTGLGLVISKEIVERHGGRIWAESKYGFGASFIFLLPLGSRGRT